MVGFSKVELFDQVRKHFGICFRAKCMPLLLQFRSEFGVVLDDAVMHDSDHASTIQDGGGRYSRWGDRG